MVIMAIMVIILGHLAQGVGRQPPEPGVPK